MGNLESMEMIFDDVMESGTTSNVEVTIYDDYYGLVVRSALGNIRCDKVDINIAEAAIFSTTAVQRKCLRLAFSDGLSMYEISKELEMGFTEAAKCKIEALGQIRKYYLASVEMITTESEYPLNLLAYALESNVIAPDGALDIINNVIGTLNATELDVTNMSHFYHANAVDISLYLEKKVSTVTFVKDEVAFKLKGEYENNIGLICKEKVKSGDLELRELDLPEWLYKAVIDIGCGTVSKLASYYRVQVRGVSTIGEAGVYYIERALAEIGLKFRHPAYR